MLKASEANTDPYLELLAVRITLSEIIGLSRAQRMLNRKARTNLTIVSNLLQPEVKDAKSKLFKRKAKETAYQWHAIPVQDQFDQRILADTGCTRGCVQNSVCDSRWTI